MLDTYLYLFIFFIFLMWQCQSVIKYFCVAIEKKNGKTLLLSSWYFGTFTIILLKLKKLQCWVSMFKKFCNVAYCNKK
jgi:hypothetical protein